MRKITGYLAMAGVLAGAAFVTPAPAQQFTMKLSSPTINDVTHEYYKRLKAGIEQSSGGKIKVEIYPANQLGQIPATVEGVALGTIEATSVANGFYVSLEPRFQVLDAPGLFPDLMTGYKVLRDPAIRARIASRPSLAASWRDAERTGSALSAAALTRSRSAVSSFRKAFAARSAARLSR